MFIFFACPKKTNQRKGTLATMFFAAQKPQTAG